MKILIVSNSLPFPPHDGVKLILFNILKHLSNRHDIDLITFLDHPSSKKNEKETGQYCNNVYTQLAKYKYSNFDKALYHLSPNPYAVVKRYSKKMEELVNEKIKREKYDIVHFNTFEMLPYGWKIKRIPKIAFVTDAISLYHKRNFIDEKQLGKKFAYLIEFLKMRSYERRIYPRFERCVVVAKVDEIALQQNCPDIKIRVVPNGVDTEYFNATITEKESASLLFTGVMDFPPNVNAVLWFVEKVLPKVRKAFRDVKLYIVGKNPSPELNHLRKDNQIIITGFVEDIRPYFDLATVYVCPMVSGSGIKNKLLEAMAMEKAIVASSLSVQGLPDAKDKSHLLIADDPHEFAYKIITLLNNSKYCQKLGKQARDLVIKKYSWENSTNLMEQIYLETLDEYRK